MIKKYIKEAVSLLILSVKLILQKFKIKNYFIWEGLYNSYDDIKPEKNSWGGDIIEQHYSKAIKDSLNQPSSFIPPDLSEENILLPILTLICAKGKNEITILDFGGGSGISYIQLRRCLVKDLNIRYHIIETESMVKHSKEFFLNDPNIFFHTKIPINLNSVDIVFVSSTLQYIRDYRRLLENLAMVKAEYLFLVKLSAGEFATYYTKQVNEARCEIPYIFHNFNEIIGILDGMGYTLVYKSVLQRRYNQQNFPIELRMDKTSNLLFERINK